jgi:hypothetical protein
MRTTPRHHHAPTGKEIESAAQSRGRAPTASRPVAAGGCPSLLMAELRQVWRLLIDMQVDLVPVYIPSDDNPADFPSRHSQSSEWSFRAGMRAELSRLSSSAFTLDPFATPATVMSPACCSLRAGEQCIANDCMCVSRRHQHVFLNPPWHLCCARSSRTQPPACSSSQIGGTFLCLSINQRFRHLACRPASPLFFFFITLRLAKAAGRVTLTPVPLTC